jgi:hypothetical protein
MCTNNTDLKEFRKDQIDYFNAKGSGEGHCHAIDKLSLPYPLSCSDVAQTPARFSAT